MAIGACSLERLMFGLRLASGERWRQVVTPRSHVSGRHHLIRNRLRCREGRRPRCPYGNVALAYSFLVGTSLSAYMELPGHHLWSTLDLIGTTLASTYVDSSEDSDT